MSLRLSLTIVTLSALAASSPAAQPQFWRLEGARAFIEGELRGLIVDSEGRVRLGPGTRPLFDPQTPTAWCVARDERGVLYVGTGNDGRLFRIEGTEGRVLFDANELEVYAVAVGPDGRVYAGTSPDGAVYAIDASGTAKVVFDPQEKYVWALAFDPAGRLLVATGGEGRLYRITPDGTPQTLLVSAETHLLSLAVDRRGNVYAGGAPEGLLYRVDPELRAFVVLDSPFREIKALALGENGIVYAAAADGRAGEAARAATPPPAIPAPPVAEVTVTESFAVLPPGAAGPVPVVTSATEAAPPSAPKGALLRLAPTGEAEMLWSSPEDMPHAILRVADGVIVATGNRGRVYRVRDDRTWVLVSTLAAEQATALAAASAGETALVSSNPARVVILEALPGREGTFVSKPRDMEAVSAWGQIRSEGSIPRGATARLETRSGNTPSPDSTWTEWSEPAPLSEGTGIRSETARHLQLRLTLSGDGTDGPVIEAVQAAYLQRNLRPQVQSILVHPPGEVFQKPISVTGEAEILGLELDPTSERAAAARQAAGSAPATAFSRKLYQKGLQTFSWRADDPNGDALTYTVLYRAVGDARWRPLRRDLAEPVLAWDTSTVPNGRYTVRVVASDAPGNPPALALEGHRDSPSFEIDNTPPILTASLEGSGTRRIRASARDDSSPIRRLEFAVDAGRWEEARPRDGIADSREESYEIALPSAPAEPPHVVVLRVTDQLGNVATARVDVP